MSRPLRVMLVAGARPNFMKVAPIVTELRKAPDTFETVLVHTGQHYDDKLSKVFFDELGIPQPDINLGVGSGSHAAQTAAIMTAVEPVLIERRPDILLVVGDVNSTIACALVAVKLGIRVGHVEAGLRSFDRTMPEEINRLLTDQISHLLFTTEQSAEENLRREGVSPEKIHFVGNVMIDTLLAHRERARELDAPGRFELEPRGYGLLTLHRPSNVDDPDVFDRLMEAIGEIARECPMLFPVHPRTKAVVTASAAANEMVETGRLRLIDPLGYLEFLSLMEQARIVLTDSGGVQEETTILGVSCLTLRENTERPVTVTHGTNQVVGTDRARILEAWKRSNGDAKSVSEGPPPLWDGRAAGRIAGVISKLSR